MSSDWKNNLANAFEEIAIIQKSKKETLEQFRQFCEFVVEPAFELFSGEMRIYGLRSKWLMDQTSITFQINFGRTQIENFQYTLFLPKNSVELVLKLKIRGRVERSDPLEEKEEPLTRKLIDTEPLKWQQSDLIQDLIEHYRIYRFKSLTSQD
ncbi:hypothetical protein ACFLT9_04885 [Acidobacteriota bacterium]